ncbi:MAG: methyltransferase domain-containing protein [Gammaproteobacteria bacterium]
MNIEGAVLDRYTAGARARQEALCCPVDYDNNLLAILPQEIIERDYGCGDPSRYVQSGDTVLDLGSGGGKICYMAAQLVGPRGRVIGIDMNDEMLSLARKYQSAMAARLGGDRVEFLKGKIQDLALDIRAMQDWLAQHPVQGEADRVRLRQQEEQQKATRPLVRDSSVDLVISNCVLNLVADSEKQQMVSEVFRVLKPGGRIAISDIISDRPVPADMKQDPELWSGCLSGAFHEKEMPAMFAAAGFSAVTYDQWDVRPWRVINGITFRSVTLTAVRPAMTDDGDARHALVYRGPFESVTDESGRCYRRGERVFVTAERRRLLTGPAYDGAFIDLTPAGESQAACCSTESAGGGCCG